MASPDKQIELGATPGRLCLVVVLGIILIIVLYVEFSKDRSANAQATTVPPQQRAIAARSASTNTAKGRHPIVIPADVSQPEIGNHRGIWNAVSLASSFEHDPFAVPAAFLPPTTERPGPKAQPLATKMEHSVSLDKQREEREKQAAAEAQARDDAMNALEKLGVSVVLRGNNQWIAVVGDKTIRVGDQLGSFRVIEILPNGVVIEDLARHAE